MILVTHLLHVADTFAAATGRKRATVSTLIFKQGGRLDRLASGRDVHTESLEAAFAWLAAHWPENTPWPEWPAGRPGWLEHNFQPSGKGWGDGQDQPCASVSSHQSEDIIP